MHIFATFGFLMLAVTHVSSSGNKYLPPESNAVAETSSASSVQHDPTYDVAKLMKKSYSAPIKSNSVPTKSHSVYSAQNRKFYGTAGYLAPLSLVSPYTAANTVRRTYLAPAQTYSAPIKQLSNYPTSHSAAATISSRVAKHKNAEHSAPAKLYSAPMNSYLAYSAQPEDVGGSASYSAPLFSVRNSYSASAQSNLEPIKQHPSYSAEPSAPVNLYSASMKLYSKYSAQHDNISGSASYSVPLFRVRSSYSAPAQSNLELIKQRLSYSARTVEAHESSAHSAASSGHFAPTAPPVMYPKTLPSTIAHASYFVPKTLAQQPPNMNHAAPKALRARYSVPIAHYSYSPLTTSNANHFITASYPALMSFGSASRNSFFIPMMKTYKYPSVYGSKSAGASSFSAPHTGNLGSYSSGAASALASANYALPTHITNFSRSTPAAAVPVGSANYAYQSSGHKKYPSTSHTTTFTQVAGGAGSAIVDQSASAAAASYSAPAYSTDTKYASNGGYLYRY